MTISQILSPRLGCALVVNERGGGLGAAMSIRRYREGLIRMAFRVPTERRKFPDQSLCPNHSCGEFRPFWQPCANLRRLGAVTSKCYPGRQGIRCKKRTSLRAKAKEPPGGRATFGGYSGVGKRFQTGGIAEVGAQELGAAAEEATRIHGDEAVKIPDEMGLVVETMVER